MEDRLESLESMLATVVSQSALVLEVQQNSPALRYATQSETSPDMRPVAVDEQTGANTFPMQTLKDVDLEDDTVDGMGVIAFADEFASAHFGTILSILFSKNLSNQRIGATSNPAFSNKINHALKDALNANKQISTLAVTDGNLASHISRPPSPYAMVCEKLTTPPRFERLNIFELPSTTVITELVDKFFGSAGMMFPYIYKKSIYDGIGILKRLSFRGIRRSWLCLLNTIMAFATVLAPSQEHKEESISKADMFLQRALQLLPNVALQPANIEIRKFLIIVNISIHIGEANAGTVQALLLLTQFLQGTQRSTQTYNFQGLTVRVAFQIGAHCTVGNGRDTMLEREIKKRCWCMAFILDKFVRFMFPTAPS